MRLEKVLKIVKGVQKRSKENADVSEMVQKPDRHLHWYPKTPRISLPFHLFEEVQGCGHHSLSIRREVEGNWPPFFFTACNALATIFLASAVEWLNGCHCPPPQGIVCSQGLLRSCAGVNPVSAIDPKLDSARHIGRPKIDL